MGILNSLFGKQRFEETAAVADADVSAAKPIHVTDATFEEQVLQAELPVLVDFWAPWCAPCRMIAPVVEDLARDYEGRAIFAKINTDENVQVAGSLGIMGIPTLIFFKGGREVDRVVGFVPRRTLESKLEALLD